MELYPGFYDKDCRKGIKNSGFGSKLMNISLT